MKKGLQKNQKSLLCNIGLKRGTLSLASPHSGTKRKTALHLFFTSTGGLRLPLFQTYMHKDCFIFDFFTVPFLLYKNLVYYARI